MNIADFVIDSGTYLENIDKKILQDIQPTDDDGLKYIFRDGSQIVSYKCNCDLEEVYNAIVEEYTQ